MTPIVSGAAKLVPDSTSSLASTPGPDRAPRGRRLPRLVAPAGGRPPAGRVACRRRPASRPAAGRPTSPLIEDRKDDPTRPGGDQGADDGPPEGDRDAGRKPGGQAEQAGV